MQLSVDFVRRVMLEKLRAHYAATDEEGVGGVSRAGDTIARNSSVLSALHAFVLDTDEELLKILTARKDLSGTIEICDIL